MLASLALAVVGAPVAAANVPAPVITTNTVRDQPGGTANGLLTTTVTYTDTAATAAAATIPNAIALRPGVVFRLRTCVAYHLNAAAPESRCAERSVDTRANTATVSRNAPSVTLAGRPRPTTQPWGYFTSYTEVSHVANGAWAYDAHSWPSSGLQGAGTAVAPQEQDVGTLPPNGSVTLDTFDTAINSGQADSICTPAVWPPNGSPLPAGVTTSHVAYAGAPGYYEIGTPTGAFAGQQPRGIMLVIHGGGWASVGVGAVQSMRPDADRWRARGWTTVNITYRGCGRTVADVLWFYDRTRAAIGAAPRICALGTSAGGNLALLIGANRPDLYCAVSQAGPTDLRTIQSELAYDPATGGYTQTLGGRYVHNLGAAAFGEENLASFSPAALASGLSGTRVLQGFSADDTLVPYQQTADLADAMRAANLAAYVDRMQLAFGTIPFGHGRVTRAAQREFFAREEGLVGPVSGPPLTLGPP
ncbi:MAG: alpha/beta hydrolase family protein [Solirubrobacteraceae bacterium]